MNPLNWIYPPRCMSCRNILPAGETLLHKRRLCEACKDLFVPITPPVCARCGHPLPDAPEQEASGNMLCSSCPGKAFDFTRNRAVFAYEDLVRELLHEMKFRNKRQIAMGCGVLFADAFMKIFTSLPESMPDFIVPVPMFPKKERKRGFNQAMLMAKALSSQSGVPAAELVTRVRDTPPQSGLSAYGRAENMKGAFRFAGTKIKDIKGKQILLIDDIYTTGSTLNACARVLARQGANVSGMTFAIAVKKDGN